MFLSRAILAPVDVLAVIDDPTTATVALDPLRSRLLARLAAAPASAAELATQVGTTRQRVTYHLRALADRGLVVEVGQRRHGGLVERLYSPSAASYVVSPAALGEAGAEPARITDRLSASYLLALAARAVREVGALARGARGAGLPLPTLSIDTEVRFRSPADRAAFARELEASVLELVVRHHDEQAPDGRWYRVVTLSHPRPPEDQP